MTDFARTWAGKVYGTNTGNITVKLAGEAESLTGKLRFMDDRFGMVIYNLSGTFLDDKIVLSGDSETVSEELEFGKLSVKGILNQRGELKGEWETSIGTGGPFALYPHNSDEEINDSKLANQLHIARHEFQSIEIYKSQIIQLSELLNNEFGQVAVTTSLDTN